MCSRDEHCTTASLRKVPPLKVGMYLIPEVHNTLFADPTQVANKWKVKCKNAFMILLMSLFFHLLTNDHFQGDFVNKLYI